MRQSNTVQPENRGTKPVASRQDIAKQIAQLKIALRTNLIRAGGSALNGNLDTAVSRLDFINHQVNRLKELTAIAGELSFLGSVPDKSQTPRKAATKTVVKPKRYARFSDK